MFGEFVEARAGETGRKSWAIVISMASQTAALLALLLMPLLYTEALPNFVQSMKSLMAPAVPLVEAPKPPQVDARPVRRPERFIVNNVLHAPAFIPPTVAIFEEPPLAPDTPASTFDSGLGDLLGSLAPGRSEAPAPVALPATPTLIQRIRQSQIEPAMVVSQPQPAYPSIARDVRIQGDVILHAIIDKEGRVAELEAVSGHPLLVRAALEAVRTWRYRPTLLNGEPVEVETTIKVSFVLGR